MLTSLVTALRAPRAGTEAHRKARPPVYSSMIFVFAFAVGTLFGVALSWVANRA